MRGCMVGIKMLLLQLGMMVMVIAAVVAAVSIETIQVPTITASTTHFAGPLIECTSPPPSLPLSLGANSSPLWLS